MVEKYLKLLTRDQLQAWSKPRAGEQKLAESILLPEGEDLHGILQNSAANFVLLGVKEDIGIRGNLGVPGARNAWDVALKALFAVQSNRYLAGDNILALGALEFEELLEEADGLSVRQDGDVKRFRELCAQVDEVVSATIEAIVRAGKIPIVIGGGHNNSYGNLKGCSQAIGTRVACLNIDPHADYRALEGRHSGNGFSYARHEGHLGRYAIFGLHESYNSEAMLHQLSNDREISFQSFEGLLALNSIEFQQRFKNLLQWCGQGPFGLELDMDTTTNFPVSALNPSGFTLNQLRVLVSAAAALKAPHYFHICEASPDRCATSQEQQLMGKSIAFLITDFVKNFRP